jgi:hypothetical protein
MAGAETWHRILNAIERLQARCRRRGRKCTSGSHAQNHAWRRPARAMATFEFFVRQERHCELSTPRNLPGYRSKSAIVPCEATLVGSQLAGQAICCTAGSGKRLCSPSSTVCPRTPSPSRRARALLG